MDIFLAVHWRLFARQYINYPLLPGITEGSLLTLVPFNGNYCGNWRSKIDIFLSPQYFAKYCKATPPSEAVSASLKPDKAQNKMTI